MKRARTLTTSILVAGLVAAAPAARAQEAVEPECVAACRDMIARGELSGSVNEIGCQVRVCQERARAYYQDNEFEKALASLDQVHEKVAFSPGYQFTRGLVHYALGRFGDALANFDAVLEVRPKSVRASAQRAHTLIRLDRLPEARAQFRKMLDFPKADVEYKNLRTRSYIKGNLGLIRLMEEDLSGAKADLSEALSIDGRNQLARTFQDKIVPELEARRLAYGDVRQLVIAFEELALKRANQGLRELSGVLNRSPDFRLGYLLAAETQRRYLDFKGCELTLRMAEKRFPEDTEVFANRIRCTMLRYGIHDPKSVESIAELKALAAKNPNDPLVQEMLLLITD